MKYGVRREWNTLRRRLVIVIASKTYGVFLVFDESQVLLGLRTTLHARIASPRYHSTRSRAPNTSVKLVPHRPKLDRNKVWNQIYRHAMAVGHLLETEDIVVK